MRERKGERKRKEVGGNRRETKGQGDPRQAQSQYSES